LLFRGQGHGFRFIATQRRNSVGEKKKSRRCFCCCLSFSSQAFKIVGPPNSWSRSLQVAASSGKAVLKNLLCPSDLNKNQSRNERNVNYSVNCKKCFKMHVIYQKAGAFKSIEYFVDARRLILSIDFR